MIETPSMRYRLGMLDYTRTRRGEAVLVLLLVFVCIECGCTSALVHSCHAEARLLVEVG